MPRRLTRRDRRADPHRAPLGSPPLVAHFVVTESVVWALAVWQDAIVAG